jgi:hypothetical protein
MFQRATTSPSRKPKHRNCFCRPVQLHQAGSILCQGGGLGCSELDALRKMLGCGREIMLLIGQRRQHGMAGGIVRPLLENAVQMGNGAGAARLVLQLGRAFERRKIVWRNAQRIVVSLQCPAVVTEPCKCNPLQGPEFGIARGVPQLRVRQLQRLSKVSRPERRLDFLGWVAARSALRKSRTNQQQNEEKDQRFWPPCQVRIALYVRYGTPAE